MEYKATQKFVLSSPKKLREVVALIKKLSPLAAVERLPFAGKRAAKLSAFTASRKGKDNYCYFSRLADDW